MTEQDLQAIEQRNAARTPGEWKCSHPLRRYSVATNGTYTSNPSLITTTTAVAHCYGENFADGDFIAACSVDIPALLSEVRRLQAEVARLTPADY